MWAVLVALGIGQMLIDFVFWAHMLHMPLEVGPFDMMAAGTLVVFTGILGYAMGYVGGIVWNKVHRV